MSVLTRPAAFATRPRRGGVVAALGTPVRHGYRGFSGEAGGNPNERRQKGRIKCQTE